jgi:hypothetical protein
MIGPTTLSGVQPREPTARVKAGTASIIPEWKLSVGLVDQTAGMIPNRALNVGLRSFASQPPAMSALGP